MGNQHEDVPLGAVGHRELISFAQDENDELLWFHRFCEDPTCDWHVSNYGPGTMVDFYDLLDTSRENIRKSRYPRSSADASRHTDRWQGELFRGDDS